ncbi:MAG TPA: RNA methyltransferase [Oceanithermus profundus]|uniref:tRNA (cytidine/uridine-2'-O-)-methyltransferase TrmJ n=1 Tax=Oceanithermus profundus TaxID=187137 RepID=A0A7C5SQC8_9DEIN|nr:RNA methyltransferase [Oceanithermus profundus]
MIRVVLVEPREPRNVGAAARAMKNFGLEELVLVNPERPLDEAAYRLATRGAADVLERSRTVATLDEALADTVYVVATSARAREGYAGEVYTPREGAPRVRAMAAEGPVALLFGRENFGLSNEEMDRAHAVWRIPTGGYASLNLAQAVLLVGYEVFLARAEPRGTARPRPAAAEELERLFADLEAYLIQIRYTDEHRLEGAMRAFRRMAHRALLSPNEVQRLRGLLRQSRWAIAHGGERVD